MDTPLALPQEQPAALANARRYAIVLAGGSGTRLWPLSRASMPKQLLALNGAESLLQQTARRLAPMVDPARVVTVTHADHRFEVTGQLHAVDPRLASVPLLLLGEPGTGRGLLARYVHVFGGVGGAWLEIDCRGVANAVAPS